jgi:hypothetical protein
MSPERRKILRGMVAAMAAGGATVGARHRALASQHSSPEMFARAIGKSLSQEVNTYFDTDHIHATAAHFKKLFGADGHRYKFGHWILRHDKFLGSPDAGMSDVAWRRVVDVEIDPEISSALTSAIRRCLVAKPPIPIKFVCSDDLSANRHHVLTIAVDNTLPEFKGRDGCIITVKCAHA